MKKLEHDFYLKDTLTVAKELLGKYLIHHYDGNRLVGKIVETEAYIGPHDKAAHAYGGKKTPRNEVMFEAGGVVYVFIIYGMYNCFNVVTGAEGQPEAVLIRALEPIEGLESMSGLRFNQSFDTLKSSQKKNLTNGPGKLCQALGITRADNGLNLCGDKIYIADNAENSFEIETSPRINIQYAEEYIAMPWRFYIKNNPYVSKGH